MQDLDFNAFFESLTSEDSIAIMALMLLAFLFGVIITYILRSIKVRKLRKELKNRKLELDAAHASIEQINEKLKVKESDIQRLKYDIQEANARADKIDRDRTKFYNDAFQLKKQLEQSELSKQEIGLKLEKLTDQLGKMQEVNDDLQGKVDRADDDTNNLAQMQSVFLATKSKVGSLEDRIASLEQENKLLKEELENNGGDYANGLVEERVITDQPFVNEEPPIVNTSEKPIVFQKIDTEGQAKDDLTMIEGIGPFLEKQLNDLGIFTFADLASIQEDRIPELTRAIGHIPGRIQRDNWIGQAREFAELKISQPEIIAERSIESPLPQDLTIIEGIGPKIESILNEGGINTWLDLAERDIDEIKSILIAAGPGYQIIDPTSWPAQAQLAINGEWELLKEYREEVKGE